MKKLLSLLRAVMSQDMNVFKTRAKNETKVSKLILPIALALIVMVSIGSYIYMIAEELAPIGLTYIVLTIFIMLTSLLTVVEGVYKSQGILFEAKDNDLLFSLPISKSKIFFTRIFKFTAFQLLYNSLFLLPAIIVYAIFETPNVSFYLISFVMLLLAPIIPTIVAAIVGYIIKAISSKFKAKNIVQVILTSIMLLCIFYASFNTQGMIANIAKNANSINEVITRIYYPAGLYVNLIQNFNIIDLLILFAINIIPAILFVYVASIFYFKIISKSGEKSSISRKNINKKSANRIFKQRSQLSGLISKEIKRFFSSPVFIINSGFGMVLMIAITALISINFEGMANNMIKQQYINMPISEIRAMIPKIFYGFVVFLSCMTSMTSSMISLEGKSFNITKSLPVTPQKILLAKVLTSNIISIPVILLCDIVFFVVFKVAITDIVFILLASIIMPTFTAIIGILMNLKYPKMDATSDTEIVKQSMSSTISVFIGMFVGMLSIAALVLGSKININLFIIIELLIFSIIDIILWKILRKYGVKKWRSINT